MQETVKTAAQALTALQMLCAKAERSSGDAMRLMARWNVEPAERARVLEKLLHDRYIDDSRYAGAYVRDKSRLAGWGAHKIRMQLAAKGIARETIEEALAQIDPETTAGKLDELLARKMRTAKAKDAHDLRGKLLRFGLGRGFGYAQVARAVERMVKTEE